MGMIELASRRSQMRGLDYYRSGAVLSLRIRGNAVDAEVAGHTEERYLVHLDLLHPRSSTCTCAFAEGRRVVCKHMVAAYFAYDPDAVQGYLARIRAEEEEFERYQQDMQARTERRIETMSKDELRDAVWYLLNQADDALYERFQRDWVE